MHLISFSARYELLNQINDFYSDRLSSNCRVLGEGRGKEEFTVHSRFWKSSKCPTQLESGALGMEISGICAADRGSGV